MPCPLRRSQGPRLRRQVIILVIIIGIETTSFATYLWSRPTRRDTTARLPVAPASAPSTIEKPELTNAPPSEIVVSAKGDSRFSSLTAALEHSLPGARIKVRPGKYHERIVLNKAVEITGDGPPAEIILKIGTGSVVVMKTRAGYHPRVDSNSRAREFQKLTPTPSMCPKDN